MSGRVPKIPTSLRGGSVTAGVGLRALFVGSALWLCGAVAPAYAISDADREAALTAVQQEYDSLPGQDLDADAQTMRDFLLGRSEFVSVGITDVPKSVWAVFDDGQPIAIEFRQLPPPPSRPHRLTKPVHPSAAADDLPHSANARILTAMGGLWPDATPDITAMLNDAGYSFVIGADASVDSLKTVSGDGVFYIATHGAPVSNTGQFAVSTSTPTDITFEQDGGKYHDDMLGPAPRLIRMLERGDFLVKEWRYGITEDFITAYWGNFAPSALVYFDACGSDSPAASNFKAAVRAKGSPVYAGWSDDTNALDYSPTARFVFDRLLGANKVDLEDGYNQRPFDYPSAVQDMPHHGRGTSGAAILQFTPVTPGPNDFSQLAPSIMTMSIDEIHGRLTIFGQFGNDPGESDRSVEIGGTPLGACSWNATGDTIACDIPRSGSGSSGDVVVKSRNHKSNIARLTEWRAPFNVTTTGSGSLTQAFTLNVHLRADIRRYRPVIHFPPSEPSQDNLTMVLDSSASYSASGTATGTGDPPVTFSWNGSGFLLPYDGVLSDGFFDFFANVIDSHTFYVVQFLGLAGSATTGASCSFDPPGVTIPLAVLFMTPQLPPLTLDDSGTIQAGSVAPVQWDPECTPGLGQETVTWTAVAATSGTAPDPNSAR